MNALWATIFGDFVSVSCTIAHTEEPLVLTENQAPRTPRPLSHPITNCMDIRWQVVAYHTAVDFSRTHYSFLDAEICD